MRRNIAYTDSSPDQVQLNQGDAVVVMILLRSPKDRFDGLDLDSYGSAVPSLESATYTMTDRGVLAVTCTDLALKSVTHSTELHLRGSF